MDTGTTTVDAFLSVDPASLPDAALADLLVRVEGVVRRAQALQVAAVRAFHARDVAGSDGAASTACWLRDRLALTDRDARRLVGLARGLDRLPLTAAALALGQVAVDHARVLSVQTKQLSAETVAAGEPFLVGWARRLDAGRFAGVVRRWVATVAPGDFERDTERRYDARWLSLSATFGGMTHVAGMLDPEGGAILSGAIDALVRANPADDTRTRDQQRADALVDLVELARAHDLLPTSGGHRPEILVHVPAAAFARGGAPSAPNAATAATEASVADGAAAPAAPQDRAGAARVVAKPTHGAGAGALEARQAAAGSGGGFAAPATLADGSPVTAAALDRLACDARFRRLVLDAAGVPVELGRATRLVPPALRTFVALRDGGCRYPGCPRGAAYCEAHHVVYWRHGGATSATNLVLLCRYHHHLVHDRGHALALLPDGNVRVTRPDGRTLSARPRGPTPAAV